MLRRSFPIALYRLIFERNPTGHGPPRVSPERVSADDRPCMPRIASVCHTYFTYVFSDLSGQLTMPVWELNGLCMGLFFDFWLLLATSRKTSHAP